MYNPAHPSDVLREWISDGRSVEQAADASQIDRETFVSELSGNASVTDDIARKLTAWLGTSEDLWIRMKRQRDSLPAQQPAV